MSAGREKRDVMAGDRVVLNVRFMGYLVFTRFRNRKPMLRRRTIPGGETGVMNGRYVQRLHERIRNLEDQLNHKRRKDDSDERSRSPVRRHEGRYDASTPVGFGT